MSRLDRFREAQADPFAGFASALEEMRAGGKRGHWIWYVFPQIDGLGMSGMARQFALHGEEEAVEFLRDAELRERLVTITRAVADALRKRPSTSLRALMGSDIDAKKVVSSLTLFAHTAKKLQEQERSDVYGPLATVAEDVLAVATSQGYPRCAYTLSRLRATN